MQIVDVTDYQKCCCSCIHNKRTGEITNIKCHCDIDEHFIGYVGCFDCVCEKWEGDTDADSN